MASSYDSDNYLNNSIEKTKRREKNTDEIIAWYFKEYGHNPSGSNLKKEIKRLDQWLYKGKDHIAFTKKIKAAKLHIEQIGYNNYYFEEAV